MANFNEKFSEYLNDESKPIDYSGISHALWEEYVPSSGKSPTVGGEILRAFVRINYRFYNDGDMFTVIGTDSACENAAGYLYLSRNVPYEIREAIIGFDGEFNENWYENHLKELEYIVINTLCSNPSLFALKNTEDMLDFDCPDELREETQDFDLLFVEDEDLEKYGFNRIRNILDKIVDDAAWYFGLYRIANFRWLADYVLPEVTGVPSSKVDDFSEYVEDKYNNWIEEHSEE